MSRLMIVSNRLPLTVTCGDAGVQVEPSTGGLASGLRGSHRQSDGLWIGWPGDTSALGEAERTALERSLAELRAVPVYLDPQEIQRFYEGVSSGVLWPLFHYLLDQVPLHVQGWDTYREVNQRFADVVAAHYQPGDVVWVHDYHLMLVPQMLRRRLPDAQIGFFLHVPFPACEVFRTLPFADRLLEGVLGADLVGFHTASYMRHFAASLLRILGLEVDVDRLRIEHRAVHLGVFPMGIDAQRFASLAAEPEIVAEARALRGAGDEVVFVAIDRLDYTKGIPRRLLAFEELLRRHPSLRERVRLIQVAVPSRTGVEAYQEFRRHLDELVGRLNGDFATPRWVPVHYIYRSLSERDLVTLYRAADVMLVTPMRDGMNLVAKEFVASRTDEDGVLVLSEFAGAASELAEALHLNPYDVDRAADMYHWALTMPPDERRARMRGLQRRVFAYDIHRWSRSFVDALATAAADRDPALPPLTPPADLRQAIEQMRAAAHLLLLLDYDGTLVPFAGVPELASPDGELIDLLRALAARPRTAVHVTSGRSRETIERWLGASPVGLHAEHGFWSRCPGQEKWMARPLPPMEWRERVLAILEQATARTPGSLVEEKSVSLAWHYRMADREFGAAQAKELRSHLTELLSNAPVEIISGERVVEVRPQGVHKGIVVRPLLKTMPVDTLAMAAGDDRTDEDLFAALPSGALALHVGPGDSRATLRVAGVADVRRFLGAVLAE